MPTTNEITLGQLSGLLAKAVAELKAENPDAKRSDLIAELEVTAKTLDSKKTVVAQAITDAKVAAIAATERIRELQPLALEIARLGCAEHQQREMQIRANDQEEDRVFRSNFAAGWIIFTTFAFVIGGFAFLGSPQASSSHAAGLIGLAVCWTILAIACLNFIGRSKRG